MAADPPPPKPRVATGMVVMGSEMAGFTVLGVVLDFALDTMPWFTIGLTLLGFITVFIHLLRFAKQLGRSKGNPP